MIRMHYLRIGRPIFTVWLLEELGLDYELEIYLRDPQTMRAPPELKQVHPLGKSPVIQDGDLTLSESGAIASYLIETYDTDGRFAPPPDDRQARARYDQWLHYAEGSAFAPLLLKLLLSREQPPLPTQIRSFAAGEIELHLSYIADSLDDKPYILGDELRGPDFGLGQVLNFASRLGELSGRPVLQAYLERMTSRPAFRRARERTGE